MNKLLIIFMPGTCPEEYDECDNFFSCETLYQTEKCTVECENVSWYFHYNFHVSNIVDSLFRWIFESMHVRYKCLKALNIKIVIPNRFWKMFMAYTDQILLWKTYRNPKLYFFTEYILFPDLYKLLPQPLGEWIPNGQCHELFPNQGLCGPTAGTKLWVGSVISVA